MNRTFRSLLAACLAVSFALAALPAQTLQMADGRVLLAKVTDATGDGCRVQRLDNGGVLDLRWDHLTTACATQVKRAWNLIGDSESEILVRADEVEFLVNGQRQTWIGKIVAQGDDHIVLRVRGTDAKIPRGELRTVRNVEVPAMQVYTRDEFYTSRLQELRPGESADKHMLLAEDMIKVRDYEHAGLHLQRATELGNSADPGRLEQLVQRLERYKAAAKERELLDQIVAARSRGKLADFEKGRELIADFEQRFAQSKLKADFEQEKKRFAQARTRYLSQQVAEQWRRSIGILADKKAADAAVSLDAAREYAESRMTDDIVARVAEQLRLEADEVRELWAMRAQFPVGKRTEHFAYGVGSWVLGEEAILKGTKQGDANAKQQDDAAAGAGNSDQVERLARALREAMKRRSAQVQGQGGALREQDPDDWWRESPRNERATWLRAYYAERGGQLVITFQTVSPCISCYGDGTTPEIDGEGKLVRNKCFLCQGTKWLRSFKAY